MGNGVPKRLRILYRPFAGSSLFFYNENLMKIYDPAHLYHSETVIFTNINRDLEPHMPFEGHILFDQVVPVQAKSTLLHNRLTLVYPNGEWTFYDEFSLFSWGRNVEALVVAHAYIQ